jgi:hypothetical protein
MPKLVEMSNRMAAGAAGFLHKFDIQMRKQAMYFLHRKQSEHTAKDE